METFRMAVFRLGCALVCALIEGQMQIEN